MTLQIFAVNIPCGHNVSYSVLQIFRRIGNVLRHARLAGFNAELVAVSFRVAATATLVGIVSAVLLGIPYVLRSSASARVICVHKSRVGHLRAIGIYVGLGSIVKRDSELVSHVQRINEIFVRLHEFRHLPRVVHVVIRCLVLQSVNALHDVNIRCLGLSARIRVHKPFVCLGLLVNVNTTVISRQINAAVIRGVL